MIFHCDENECEGCPNDSEREVKMKLDAALDGKSLGNMPVVYVSGPMSGLPDHNFPAFNTVARRLRLLGFPVLNPADFGNDPKYTWEDCMRRDLPMIRYADVVVFLDGWEGSKGSRLEREQAIDLGKPCVSLRCFTGLVVSRFYSLEEYSDILMLDNWRNDHVIARFDNALRVLTREDAEALRLLNDILDDEAEGEGEGDAKPEEASNAKG